MGAIVWMWLLGAAVGLGAGSWEVGQAIADERARRRHHTNGPIKVLSGAQLVRDGAKWLMLALNLGLGVLAAGGTADRPWLRAVFAPVLLAVSYLLVLNVVTEVLQRQALRRLRSRPGTLPRRRSTDLPHEQ